MKITRDIVVSVWPKIKECINFDELVPHMMQVNLADLNDFCNLTTGDPVSRQNYFFKMLPSKGPDSYQLLYECVSKETSHRGHEYVKEVLEGKAGKQV